MAAEDAIDFQAIFEATPIPLIVLSPEFQILGANDQCIALLRYKKSDLVGRTLFEAMPGDFDRAGHLRTSLERVLATGLPDTVPFLRETGPGGPIAHPKKHGRSATRSLSFSHIPLKGHEGEVRFILQHVQETIEGQNDDLSDTAPPRSTPQHRAERFEALNMSLLAESAQLRNLFLHAPSFMCVLRGPEYTIELANLAFMDLIGQRRLIGRTLREAIPEIDGQLYIGLLDKVFQTGEPFVGKQMRAEFERNHGRGPEEVFISFVFQPLLGEDGQVLAIFIDGNDVTDHVRAERSQALLVRELHHRVRNTLATVQGVMNSTARTAETIEDYQWAFSGRISSLARTHSLLTEEIQQFVSFSNLLRQEIGAYAEGESDRVVLEGPDVELPSQLAVPLGMTIHELATNAYRHGSLSAPDGRVTVTWSIQPAKEKRILICRWSETGGPPVTPPARNGFGTMILTRVLSQQIGATVHADYLPDGFELRADIPLIIERV